MEKSESLFIFNELGLPDVVFDSDTTKLIAGYECKRAVLTYPGKHNTKIDAWYSEDIKVVESNRNTPFEGIPGTLLEFKVNYHNYTFHFTAEKIKNQSIDLKEFSVPDGYTKTNKNEIKDIVGTLLE